MGPWDGLYREGVGETGAGEGGETNEAGRKDINGGIKLR